MDTPTPPPRPLKLARTCGQLAGEGVDVGNGSEEVCILGYGQDIGRANPAGLLHAAEVLLLGEG